MMDTLHNWRGILLSLAAKPSDNGHTRASIADRSALTRVMEPGLTIVTGITAEVPPLTMYHVSIRASKRSTTDHRLLSCRTYFASTAMALPRSWSSVSRGLTN